MITAVLVLTLCAVTASSKLQEVFIKYTYSDECAAYLKFALNDKGATLPSTPHKNVPARVLRDATIAQSIRWPVGSSAIKWVEDVTESHGFYDTTTVEFLTENRGLSINNTKGYEKFQWLKYIEIDRAILTDDVDINLFLARVKTLPCVDFAEIPIYHQFEGGTVDNPLSATFMNASVTELFPNDPYFSSQYFLHKINAPAAWDKWTGPTPTNLYSIVGVADTGCHVIHYDMYGRFWKNPGEICGNGVDDDHNGYVDDCYGWNFEDNDTNIREDLIHGTPVSGAITANTNNHYGITGICWSCKVMCLKIGSNSLSVGAFAEAINYARGFGIKIINFSAGGRSSLLEKRTIESARDSGMMLVVAAGNSNCDLDSANSCALGAYPPMYGIDNILVVGSTGRNDVKATFSNYGSFVDVLAPGVDMFLPTMLDNGLSFQTVSGTSFSSPLTAGLAALIWSRYPTLTYKAVIQAIVKSCRHVESVQGYASCGGIIDVNQALSRADELIRQR